jgi:hypothetical protein
MIKGLSIKIGARAVALLLAVGAGIFAWHNRPVNQTIEQLLQNNQQLKQAISNLKTETQIGYAKVLSQTDVNDVLCTKLLFVETEPNEPLKPILRKEFELQGDVVHFDALIVKFGQQLVMDGSERAIYLWRRIYGDTMRPQDGFSIEQEGVEPARYGRLCEALSLEDRQLFWESIWDLSNDPYRLEQMGIRAVYGNVVYQRLQPGLIYIFKISPTGTLFPEVIPDL